MEPRGAWVPSSAGTTARGLADDTTALTADERSPALCRGPVAPAVHPAPEAFIPRLSRSVASPLRLAGPVPILQAYQKQRTEMNMNRYETKTPRAAFAI